MATNPWSATLANVPGFAKPKPISTTPFAPPPLALAPVPAAPDMGGRVGPNAAVSKGLRDRLAQLPGIYDPERRLAVESTKSALKGFGDYYTFGPDDPNTPQDESLVPKANENAQAGNLYRRAIEGARARAAAHGRLYSSATDEDVGQEVTTLNEKQAAVMSQYGARLMDIATRQRTEQSGIVGQIGQSEADDTRWLQDHPPPVPEPAPVAAVPEPPQTVGQFGIDTALPQYAWMAGAVPRGDGSWQTPDGQVFWPGQGNLNGAIATGQTARGGRYTY